MHVRKLPLIIGFPLVLGACATAIPSAYTDPKARLVSAPSLPRPKPKTKR